MPRYALYFRRRLARRRARRKGRGSGRKHGKLFRFFVVLILLFSVFLALFLLRIKPVVTQMATASATNSITAAVNRAIRERMEDGSLEYAELVSLEKNTDGQVTALVTNMAHVNSLQADITNRVIELLSDENISEIGVPIGNIIGGTLLSGRGPRIPIRILSVSYASASFSNQFSDAGINQTRHQIMLYVTVRVTLLLPGYKTSATVSSEVSVAETVIIGGVPESYTYFAESELTESASDKYDIMT